MRTRSPISVVSPMTTPVPWSMKKLEPIVAPGWISMPVTLWASSDIILGQQRNILLPELVRDPMNGDSQYTGITDHHLINGLGGRIALVSSMYIRC